ncbi:hypothetical protein FM113_04145 [Leucobacter sp. 7(1)]|nr:hypothetical protein FM113_04145 [Leucobacter sp. 7(1)]
MRDRREVRTLGVNARFTNAHYVAVPVSLADRYGAFGEEQWLCRE